MVCSAFRDAFSACIPSGFLFMGLLSLEWCHQCMHSIRSPFHGFAQPCMMTSVHAFHQVSFSWVCSALHDAFSACIPSGLLFMGLLSLAWCLQCMHSIRSPFHGHLSKYRFVILTQQKSPFINTSVAAAQKLHTWDLALSNTLFSIHLGGFSKLVSTHWNQPYFVWYCDILSLMCHIRMC